MQYPQIVGVTGKKFNGKDTVADYLCDHHGYVKFSFAAPLKRMCQELFDFSDAQIHTELKEEIDKDWNVSPRTVLQYVGTDLFRNQINNIIPQVGQNFWIHILIKKIQREIQNNPNIKIVISDMRFCNELDSINGLNNSTTIKVIRPSINSIDTHSSEVEIDKLECCHTIINDGTVSDLLIKIQNLFVH